MRADLLFCFLFLRPVLCVCARLWLPVVLVRGCRGVCDCCGCLSLVSIFISRKCFLSSPPSTVCCRPPQSSTSQPWPIRRKNLERRSLGCRCVCLCVTDCLFLCFYSLLSFINRMLMDACLAARHRAGEDRGFSIR